MPLFMHVGHAAGEILGVGASVGGAVTGLLHTGSLNEGEDEQLRQAALASNTGLSLEDVDEILNGTISKTPKS